MSKLAECAGLGRTVHEEPVSRQHPDEHQHDGEREGQQLGQGEAAAAAKGNPGEGWRKGNREQTVLIREEVERRLQWQVTIQRKQNKNFSCVSAGLLLFS